MKLLTFFFSFLITFLQSYFSYGSKIMISFEEKVGRSPVVIEGRYLYHTAAYMRGGMIYTSFIFEVNKVFKGTLNRRYIEIPIQGGTVGNTSVSIASCGNVSIGSGILFLSVPNQVPFETTPFNSGDTLAEHFIVDAYYDALLYDLEYISTPVYLENVEHNLYRKIESLTHIKRKIIQNPEPQNPKIHEWLKQNNKSDMLRQHGIHLSLHKSQYIAEPINRYSVDVWATSTSGFTDLNQAEITIHYNPETFGTYAVKNERVMITHIYMSGKAYDIDLADLDSSNIIVRIKMVNKKKGVFQLKNNLCGLYFKVLNMESTGRINFVYSKCSAKYYDYEKSKIIKYAYIYSADTTKYNFTCNLQPIIDSFYPDTLRAGIDTLTIEGKFLNCINAKIQVNCARGQCSFANMIPTVVR
jgi:hypothetical protein